MRVIHVERVTRPEWPEDSWLKVTCDSVMNEEGRYTQNTLRLSRALQGTNCHVEPIYRFELGAGEGHIVYIQCNDQTPPTAHALNICLASMKPVTVRFSRPCELPGMLMVHCSAPLDHITQSTLKFTDGVENVLSIDKNAEALDVLLRMYKPDHLIAVLAKPDADLDSLQTTIHDLLTL